MIGTEDGFFETHTDPMWVYDPSSLSILDVNAAATHHYGWSRDEFLSLTLLDLHLPEDAAQLRTHVQSIRDKGVHAAGIWRHRRRDGTEIQVEIHRYPMQRGDWVVQLSSARDVTRVLRLQHDHARALERERAARDWTDTLSRRFRAVFFGLPEPLLVLSPDDHSVLAASKAYLDACGLPLGHVLGRPLPDLMAAATSAPDAISPARLRESVARVLETGAPDLIRNVIYPPFIAGPWAGRDSPARVTLCHAPVLDDRGRILCILHRIGADATQATAALPAAPAIAVADSAARAVGDLDIGASRDVQRLLRLAAWHYDPATGKMSVSAPFHDIFGTSPSEVAPTADGYLALVHPEDRDGVRDSLNALLDGSATRRDIRHRVIRPVDGRVVHVVAAGQVSEDGHGGLTGLVQDLTELIAVRDRAAHLSISLQSTLEHISDAFFTLDRDLRFVFVNSLAETLLRQQRADLVGRPIWDIFPEARDSAIGAAFGAARSSGKAVRIVEYYPPFAAWYEISVHRTPDGLAVYFRDVTADRQRDELLRLLEAAISRINDMVFITDGGPWGADTAAPIVLVNEAVVRRTGYDRDELIGQSPGLLLGPDTAREDVTRIGDAMRRGEPVQGEILFYNKRGRPFWTELDVVPLADAAGQTRHWVAIGRDVTRRRQSDEALRISEERFRLVSRATLDVIWDWDLEINNLWWSESLEALLGVGPGQLAGETVDWTSWIHRDDVQRVSDGLRVALDGGATTWQERHRMQRRDGSTRQVVNRTLIIRNAAGQPVRVLGAISDVTEQRELEERLRQSQKLEAVGQLTGGIAHDFNNLLTVILGNSEAMIDMLPPGSPMHAMAQVTATAAQRGSELTSRLLAFSRKQALDPKVLRLDRVVDGMQGLIRRALSREIEITVRGEAAGFQAEVDPGQLEVALLNLVINARDAMPASGRLDIETASVEITEGAESDLPPGQYAMVAVTDTGTGMPPEVLAKAFDPFFTTKEVGKGSGLGLSMVYGFVQQSNGHARIRSAPGEGTSVRLYFPRSHALPAAQPATVAEPEAAPPPARPQAGGEHVLLVEDHPMVREHAIGLLESLGYRVTAASGGQQALDILRRDDGIDLLFTDVVMPGGMTGLELADRAVEMRPGLRVLVTSGYAEGAMAPEQTQKRYPLLHKPYRRQALGTRVRAVLDDMP